MSDNGWLRMIEENPGRSAWYIQRFRTMAADGQDLGGEARFVDAMVPRGARILDAGCGPGRVGGRLASVGHHVVGVDIDPELIAAAEGDDPGAIWREWDLAVLDLASEGVSERFDVIVSAGNVMTFLDPGHTLRRPAVTVARSAGACCAFAVVTNVLVRGWSDGHRVVRDRDRRHSRGGVCARLGCDTHGRMEP